METSFLHSLLIAGAVGSASGAIGAFIILKRMALVGDALSHVALPGIAVALAYGIDPLWGVMASLLAAACIIWRLEQATTLPADALVGLLFTASLAVGILTIPNHEIIESLFGGFPLLSFPLLALIVGAALVATIFSFVGTRTFLFSIISPELARIHGIKRYHDAALLILFALIVALGIKLVGTLLMGALTIIPASIAKNTTGTMKSYMALSTALGGMLAVAGIIVSYQFGFLPGPTIILLGVGAFIFSLLFRR